MYRNTFSADYSDEEDHYDTPDVYDEEYDADDYGLDEEESVDSLEAMQNPIREPSIEIVSASRTFTVPASDISAAADSVMDEEISDGESPTSSPVGPIHTHELKEVEIVEDSVPSGLDAQDACNLALAEMSTQQQNYEPGDESYTYMPPGMIRGHFWPNDRRQGGSGLDGPSAPAVPTGESVRNATTLVEKTEATTADPSTSLPASHQDEHIRAPSPSDAAMVKPSVEDVSRAPPSNHLGQLVEAANEASATAQAQSFSVSASAWAEQYPVLYDESLPDNLEGFFLNMQPVPSEDIGMEPGSHDVLTLPPLQTATGSAHQPSLSGRRPNNYAETYIPISSLKRKADELSSDASAPEPTKLSGPSTTESGDAGVSTSNVEDVRGPRTSSDIEIQDSLRASHETACEPPARKKAKKNKHKSSDRRVNGSGDFIKIAAATIAGVAIGTVGTIIGLAALPPIA